MRIGEPFEFPITLASNDPIQTDNVRVADKTTDEVIRGSIDQPDGRTAIIVEGGVILCKDPVVLDQWRAERIMQDYLDTHRSESRAIASILNRNGGVKEQRTRVYRAATGQGAPVENIDVPDFIPAKPVPLTERQADLRQRRTIAIDSQVEEV